MRDQTLDEFFEKYGDHIDGKVDPQTRVANRPETVPFEEGQRK
jgi:hypothetical protein|tara:strand:+ start:707 stop:835 length:129 start_codon:yes stop_codon:yes gene_type:complete